MSIFEKKESIGNLELGADQILWKERPTDLEGMPFTFNDRL